MNCTEMAKLTVELFTTWKLHHTSFLKPNTAAICQRGEIWKILDFQPTAGYISEMIQDMHTVTMEH